MKCSLCRYYKTEPEGHWIGECSIKLPIWVAAAPDRETRIVRSDDSCDLGAVVPPSTTFALGFTWHK